MEKSRSQREEGEEEKEQLMRGFILEKDFISQEHEKEKEDIINSFVEEREDLIEKFNEKVTELEHKFHAKHSQAQNKPRRRPKLSEGFESTRSLPFNLNFGGENLKSAEEFLSTYQLKEDFDVEQDGLERSNRDEKRHLREKMQLEFEKKLQNQKFVYETTIEDLKRMIRDLKYEMDNLKRMLKEKRKEWEGLFDDKTRSLESKHLIEKDCLRDSLQMKCRNDIEAQKNNYERLMLELRKEVKRLKELLNEKDHDMKRLTARKNDDEVKIRKELNEKLRHEFRIEFEKVINEKARLNEKINVLNEEKRELADQLKQLHDDKLSKVDVLEEFSTRLNKEYETRLKASILGNEKLNFEIQQLRNENAKLLNSLKSAENEVHALEDKIMAQDRFVTGLEEKISCLREENQNFSNEISALRIKNQESRGLVEEHYELETLLNRKLSQKDLENQSNVDKYKLVEQSKLKLEQKITLVNDELTESRSENELLRRKLKQAEDSAATGERLLMEERKEQERYIARFKHDAEEIRQKETDIEALKEKLRNVEMKIAQDIDDNADNVDREMQLETINAKLMKDLCELKEQQQALLRCEREEIQKQFAKEFAKRLQSLRRNYEQATEGLIQQIRELRDKISMLESSMTTKTVKNRDTTNTGLYSKDVGYDFSMPLSLELDGRGVDEGRNDAVCAHERSTCLTKSNNVQYAFRVPAENNDLSENRCRGAASNECQLPVAAQDHCRDQRRRTVGSSTHSDACYGRSVWGSHRDRDSNNNSMQGRLRFVDNQEEISRLGGSEVRAPNASQKNVAPGILSSLPPIQKRQSSPPGRTTASHSAEDSSSHSRMNRHRQPNPHEFESQSEKLENSVEHLKRRLETSQSQMVQRIDSIQHSKGGDARSTSFKDDDRQSRGQKTKRDQLHNLLQDVKSEVARFNEMLEKQTIPKELEDGVIMYTSRKDGGRRLFDDSDLVPTSDREDGDEFTPRGVDITIATPSRGAEVTTTSPKNYPLRIAGDEGEIARQYASELKIQLVEKQLELDDTTGALSNVYTNQSEIVSGLFGSGESTSYCKAGGEKQKENILVENVTTKLQEKLNNEFELNNNEKIVDNRENEEENEDNESSCDYMLV
eukprot:gene16174-17799_t